MLLLMIGYLLTGFLTFTEYLVVMVRVDLFRSVKFLNPS